MWPALLACNPPPDLPPPADLVVLGAVVVTMDDVAGDPTALAVREGRIVYVGGDSGGRSLVGPRTQVVELEGAVVLPGFVDAHNHLLWSGADLLLVDLYAARDLAGLEAAVTSWADANPGEPWIRGGGWSVDRFLGVFDRAVLDDIVPDRPAYLYSSDAHSGVANSRALAEAGIDASTPDPADGTIERDPVTGEPTGLLIEGAMSLVEVHLPAYSHDLADQGLRDAQREANAYGVTTVVDPYLEEWMLDGYLRADARGELTVRVKGAGYVNALLDDPAAPLVALRDRGAGERVEVNAGKVFLDGVIETGTALLVDPYVDGSNAAPLWSNAALARVATQLDAAGFQLHAHVIGDGAVRQLLDAVERVEEANGPRDRRPLAAHIELVHPDDVPRFGELGVIADAQALWAYPDVYVRELTAPVVGPARTERLYPFGELHRAGATLAGGSDWSVTSQNPFLAIEVMVRRSNPWRDDGDVLSPDQGVDVRTALRAYTSDGARAAFAEREVGSLTVGKRADFVVLDADPFAVDPQDLSEIGVTATYVDGVSVSDGRRSSGVPAARRARCAHPPGR